MSTQRLGKLPPLPGQSIVLLDVGEYDGGQCESKQGSWQNEYTAELAMEVASSIAAEEASGNITIAIICPYRAQVRLLRKWIRQEIRAGNPIYQAVEVGTVHQFQGSEADVVIFDVVDGPGRNQVGRLLRGEAGQRLVNVAITRARGKLIVLADQSWFTVNGHASDNPLLWKLLGNSENGGGPTRLIVAPPRQPFLDSRYEQLESPIEEILFEAMKRIPELENVVAQHIISDANTNRIVSRADFAFPSIKLAVYCDGAQWHLRQDRWQRDMRQRNKLQSMGWIFNVFSGSEIKRDANECARQVAETFRNRRDEQARL
jgi:very-short-patch-repair endonuclease